MIGTVGELCRAFVPLPVTHLLLGDTTAALPSSSTGTSRFSDVAGGHDTAGAALWPGGSIRSHYATRQLITAHCGVMLTEGPGPPSEAHHLAVWRWPRAAVEDAMH